MAYQYANDRVLHLGSVDIRVLPYGDSGTIDDAISVGLLDGVTFNLTGDKTVISSDNSADIDLGLANTQVEIGASAWKNLDLEILYKILGQIGNYDETGSQEQEVTAEEQIVDAELKVRLKNKNRDITNHKYIQVSNLKVMKGETEVSTSDYNVSVVNGYTVITGVQGKISAKEKLTISYKFTATKSKKITYSTTDTPKELHVWMRNINTDKQPFTIEVYRVVAVTSAQFNFGSDKAKTLISMPISMIGKPDATRDPKDDLFSWTDEQYKLKEE